MHRTPMQSRLPLARSRCWNASLTGSPPRRWEYASTPSALRTSFGTCSARGSLAGLSAPEIHLTHVGSLRRRVICVHCRTVTEDVTTSIVVCLGCAAHLFVRDHFSRRLGGFQGVQVDAEVPGEVPAAEQAYP